MLKETILIDNLKCGGCKASILNKLRGQEGVRSVEVDLDTAAVVIEHDESIARSKLLSVLSKMGYPEKGTTNLIQTAKSYVSCMIGRMSDTE